MHLHVSIARQQLELWQQGTSVKSYLISTALAGIGNQEGSFQTPTGAFCICEKIGHHVALNTQFIARKPIGLWDGNLEKDAILTRILRLEGMQPSNANSKQRCIYIHGTNHEHLLGTPVSCGCIRLSRIDIAQLFDHVEEGTTLTIDML